MATYNDPSFRPVRDIPMFVSSSTTSSERRISPSWTVAEFKRRMETVTGIPAEHQALVMRSRRTGADALVPSAVDEAGTVPIRGEGEVMGAFGLFEYGEIHVRSCIID